MKKTKMQKGITLVALIITIIVLLILAMVAIRAVTGDGIIKHAQRARDDYREKSEEENGIISGYNDYINSQLGLSGGATGDNGGTSYDGMYNMPGLEGKIAPTDLFDYEPIEGTGETAALDNSTLPQKEIKITRIKPEYCNYGGYTTDDGKTFESTNYEINYKGHQLDNNILIIPYQVEYEEEMYSVTEVNLNIEVNRERNCGPKVEGIVLPNTIKRFDLYYNNHENCAANDGLRMFVLSNRVTEIPDSAFMGCEMLTSITIPKGVTRIGWGAFGGCSTLTTITYLGTQEEYTQIDRDYRWLGLHDSGVAPLERIVCSDGEITL